MFKGLGLVGFGVFCLVSTLLLRTEPGPVFWAASLASVLFGCASLWLILIPEGASGFGLAFESALPQGARSLALQIGDVCSIIRQDGLLALEAKRKEIRDPHLAYLLKRILDGFESKELIPWVRNVSQSEEDRFRGFSSRVDRLIGSIPGVGLVASLILISGVLSDSGKTPGVVGIAQIFTPFLMALVIQILLDAVVSRRLLHRKAEVALYFSTLEDGIFGIQSGLNPELLTERLLARLPSEIG